MIDMTAVNKTPCADCGHAEYLHQPQYARPDGYVDRWCIAFDGKQFCECPTQKFRERHKGNIDQ